MKNNTTTGPLLSFTGKMTGIRCINGIAIPTFWDITIDFVSVENEEETQEESALESSVKFQVLSFWMNEVMQDVIVVSVDDGDNIKWAQTLRNEIMTMPEIPTDDVFIRVLHKKILTLVGDRLVIVRTAIQSDDGGGLKYTYYGLNDETLRLPGIEYVDESLQGVKEPWWNRKTAECADFLSDTDSNVTELYTAEREDILVECEKALKQKYRNEMAPETDVNVEAFAEELLKKIQEHRDTKEENDNVIEIPTNEDNK